MTIPAGSFNAISEFFEPGAGTKPCPGCGLQELHKRCPAHNTPAFANPDHPAWGDRDKIEKLTEVPVETETPPASEETSGAV